MEDNEEYMDKLIMELWVAINKAIVSSQGVGEVVDKLERKNLIDAAIHYNLIIDTQNLIKFIHGRSGRVDPRVSGEENRTPVSRGPVHPVTGKIPGAFASAALSENRPNSGQFIDGRKLTENERLFEKYFQSCFDEKEWLKKAGIRF